MSTGPSIFDPFSTAESNGAANPFSFANEPPPSSPFAAAPMVPQSPFAAMADDSQERSIPEPGKPAKIPAPRPKSADSPFQLAAEANGHFGYEAPSPFSTVPAPTPLPVMQNPFSSARPGLTPSPFSAADPAPAAPSWTPPAPVVEPVAVAPVAAFVPSAPAPQPVAAPAPVEDHTPSYSYRQLELRAIFSVDREMTAEEILQRSRSLPGIRHIARINSQEVAQMESLRRTLQTLGFGAGSMRLYCGSVPIEFVREGNTTLAVQTDGGFAPGIRETIMIVARELDKMGPQ